MHARRTTRMTALAALAAALLVCACAPNSGDRPFGQAYTEQYQQQLVGAAYAPPAPVEGLDGPVAKRAMDRHRDPDAEKGPSFAEVLESLMEK